MSGGRDAWSFMQEFRPPASPEDDGCKGWVATEAFAGAWRALVAKELRELPRLLERWDDLLSGIGRDPLRDDWSVFRPLRRDREEDWSDWLAWLIAASETGDFSRRLLRGAAEDFASPRAEREVPVRGGEVTRRLDLRVEWQSGEHSHIEVKVGDLQLAKTFETAALHRRLVGATKCTDWILLPEGNVDVWSDVAAREGHGYPRVDAITWTDVAVAIRRSLASGAREPTTWRVWARAFLGCVEQQILYLSPIGRGPLAPDERMAEVVVHLERCLHEI